MVASIRQLVTVEEGGVIRISSPDLAPGTQVMVSVEPCAKADPTPSEMLAALHALQTSLNLTQEQVEEWLEFNRELREQSSERIEARWKKQQ